MNVTDYHEHIKVRRLMRSVTIVVIRNNSNKLQESKPCLHCHTLMHHIGVRRVIYSNDLGYLETHKIKTMKGMKNTVDKYNSIGIHYHSNRI